MREFSCKTCTDVFKIYKTVEYVSPWLCTCEAKRQVVSRKNQMPLGSGQYRLVKLGRFGWQWML
jgi:hypothetical protein